jgi:hypothetical protein
MSAQTEPCIARLSSASSGFMLVAGYCPASAFKGAMPHFGTSPSHPHPATSVVPPLHLRSTSVPPPIANGGTTQVLRRCYGGTTEVLGGSEPGVARQTLTRWLGECWNAQYSITPRSVWVSGIFHDVAETPHRVHRFESALTTFGSGGRPGRAFLGTFPFQRFASHPARAAMSG